MYKWSRPSKAIIFLAVTGNEDGHLLFEDNKYQNTKTIINPKKIAAMEI